MSVTVTEYLELPIDGYQARATGTAATVEVRVVNALDDWWIMTVKDALTNQPAVVWSPSWLPGQVGADLRHSIERRVIRAIRAHHGQECDG